MVLTNERPRMAAVQVIDQDGKTVSHVRQVDTDEGWIELYDFGPKRDSSMPGTKRVEGRFVIVLTDVGPISNEEMAKLPEGIRRLAAECGKSK